MSRNRNFSFILYPEDDLADYRWVDWLSERAVPCLAILHQPETDDEKWHVHVLAHFDSPVPRSTALETFKHDHIPVQPANVCFTPVASVRGMERYFLHLDSPTKTPYFPSDLHCLCGYHLHLDDDVPNSQPCNILYSLLHDCASYKQFVGVVALERPDLLGYLASHSYFFMSLFL